MWGSACQTQWPSRSSPCRSGFSRDPAVGADSTAWARCARLEGGIDDSRPCRSPYGPPLYAAFFGMRLRRRLRRLTPSGRRPCGPACRTGGGESNTPSPPDTKKPGIGRRGQPPCRSGFSRDPAVGRFHRLGALRAPRGRDWLASLGAAPRHRVAVTPLTALCAVRSNRRVRMKYSLSARHKKARQEPGFFVSGGEGGIRTLDTSNTYGSLAGNWFQPLTHLSGTLLARMIPA